VHGQAVVLAEAFVDSSRFVGTCYRAANWIEVGATRGFAKTNATYIEHGQPKRVLVYPLVRQARTILCSPLPHARLPRLPAKSLELSAAQAQTLLERLGNLPETRSQQGRRHRLASVLALAVCAFISGARSSAAMLQWAERASQPLLRSLRCRWDARRARFIPPSEPTLRRVLAKQPVEQLQAILGDWLQAHGAHPTA
jgi:hypothetical protein